MDKAQPDPHVVPHDSIKLYRYAVYFESEWLSKEPDPTCRMNGARRLAELTEHLADLEEAETKQPQS
jgi:hypothetical protein